MKYKKQSHRFNRDELEEQRSKSEHGRLQRTLSPTIFSQRYRDYVMSNPEGYAIPNIKYGARSDLQVQQGEEKQREERRRKNEKRKRRREYERTRRRIKSP